MRLPGFGDGATIKFVMRTSRLSEHGGGREVREPSSEKLESDVSNTTQPSCQASSPSHTCHALIIYPSIRLHCSLFRRNTVSASCESMSGFVAFPCEKLLG